MKTIKSMVLAITLITMLGHSSQLPAEQVHLQDHPLSAEEMGRLLFDQSARSTYPVKMRSISFTPKQQRPTGNEQRVEAERVSVGLPIEFAYNSTAILPDSKPFLDEVGKMLNMPEFANKHLIIEGHTDAAGSSGYNLALSKRRARAVSDFLVQNYGVNRTRLTTKGVGEQNPLEGYDPYDEVNRRVQFYSAN